MDKTTKKMTVLDQITASDKVRKKIIDTASVLYAKKGFNATTIEEIAEQAGISLPVTYHYVKKKSEIMSMIMEDVLKVFQDNLKEKIKKDIKDPKFKLEIAVDIYFRIVDEQNKKVLLIYQKSNSMDKASKSKIMRLEVELSNLFGNIITEGIEKGIFRETDVDLMAYNINMMAHMWVLKNWHFRKRLTIDQYIKLQMHNIESLLLNS